MKDRLEQHLSESQRRCDALEHEVASLRIANLNLKSELGHAQHSNKELTNIVSRVTTDIAGPYDLHGTDLNDSTNIEILNQNLNQLKRSFDEATELARSFEDKYLKKDEECVYLEKEITRLMVERDEYKT